MRRFRRFVSYVYERSPYYRRLILERKIDLARCVPADFPVLTKSDLLGNFDEIVTLPNVRLEDIQQFLSESRRPEDLFRDRYVVIHTSGSSGQVAYFLYDPSAWARGLSQLLNSGDFSLLPGKRKRIALYGATEGHFTGVSIAVSSMSPPLHLLHLVKCFEINRPIAETIAGMNEYQPDVVAGYATGLKVLAEKQLSGELRICPRGIHSSGEPLLDADRAVIERAFGQCVRNTYVSSEHMFMGMKEPGWTGMRLLEDDLIFEIYPDHVLVTNLFNRALPLIRYRMNEVLTLLDSSEHAPYRAISDIVGRVEQSAGFINEHGAMDSISPHTINEIIIPHVSRFQMRITGSDSFAFAIVFDGRADAEQRDAAIEAASRRLREILKQKEMANVRFTVLPCADLPIDPATRKFRLIVNSASG
jgi:phenylacetate-coenzyme A ligase PaaK-like adenylate-forming protein